jgi:hypothetical protein
LFKLLFNALLRGILLKSRHPQNHAQTGYFNIGRQITRFLQKNALKPFKFRLIGGVWWEVWSYKNKKAEHVKMPRKKVNLFYFFS